MKVTMDFMFDYETFAKAANAAVIDVAVIAFNPDPEVVETFDELVSRALHVKFDLKSQKGKREFDPSTIEWWKNQSPEAKAGLTPSDKDVTTEVGTRLVLEYLKEQNINFWESQGWCRGQSFDWPILVNLIRNEIAAQGEDTFKLEPCAFWNQRDVRTAIESLLLVRNMTTTPLPAGTLDGFVAHNSVHDTAKDILMLKYAKRYALGLEDAPSEEDTDPLSLPKGRG
ncbi:putative exonuclease [Serratia phage SP1]|nr:putative exonuclease [Serratia phage SP1]